MQLTLRIALCAVLVGACTKKKGCLQYASPQLAQEDGALPLEKRKEILVMCWDSAKEEKVSQLACAILLCVNT